MPDNMPPAPAWVLRDSVSKTWFRRWTPIGPECTAKRNEAATFATKHDAMNSPAFAFALAFFEPERLADG